MYDMVPPIFELTDPAIHYKKTNVLEEPTLERRVCISPIVAHPFVKQWRGRTIADFRRVHDCFDARIKATHKMIILGIELFYKLQNNRNVRVVTSNVLFPQISDFEIGNQLIFCGTPPYQEVPNIIQE